MILGNLAHSFYHEQGGSAAVASIHPRTVPNLPDGKLALHDLEAAIRSDNIHFPRTRMIALENTHNLCGGAPLDPAYLRAVGDIARRRGIRLHIDGARLFNAAAALGDPARLLAADADSISFCLSKGLAAPVGSVICGPRDFVRRAYRARKMLGGGMRQAGLLAAAGLYALDHRVERLAEDHANARRLAEGLAAMEGVICRAERFRTNIVYFELAGDRDPDAFVKAMRARGVLFFKLWAKRFRLVTHFDVEAADIAAALEAFREELTGN